MSPVNCFFRHPVAEQVREQGREEGIEKGIEKGVAQERAATILRILEWRNVSVPESVRKQVLACTDLRRLESWQEQAVRVTDPVDLFTSDQPE